MNFMALKRSAAGSQAAVQAGTAGTVQSMAEHSPSPGSQSLIARPPSVGPVGHGAPRAFPSTNFI